MEGFMKKLISQLNKQSLPGITLLTLAGLLASGCATPPPFTDLPPDLNYPVTDAAAGAGSTVSSGAPGSTNASASPNAPGSGSGLTALVQRGDEFAIGDLVTVKFSGTIETIPSHEERIKSDGTITLPLIGAVKAAGRTPGELQTEIHDLYVDEYYKRLTVTVTSEQRVYYVGGQVRSPGRQVYLGATTVTKAIQSAGDFTDFAAKRRVELTRGDKRLLIDCLKAAKDPSLDLPVFPGDKIHVDMRGLFDLFD